MKLEIDEIKKWEEKIKKKRFKISYKKIHI